MAAMRTFYKRPLPCPPCTEFSSGDGGWLRWWSGHHLGPSSRHEGTSSGMLTLRRDISAGQAIFAEALTQGTMACFFPLVEQFRWAVGPCVGRGHALCPFQLCPLQLWTHHLHITATCSTQDDPAFCGLASLAMVLNALAIDPRCGGCSTEAAWS